MKAALRAIVLVALAAVSTPALAHPAPFSYLDVHVRPDRIDVALVAHVFDLAHDLQIDPFEQLLEPAFVNQRNDAIVALLTGRMGLSAEGGAPLRAVWDRAEALPDRQSVRVQGRYVLAAPPGAIDVEARMFPYDPAHETFLNFYENDDLSLQAILDAGRTRIAYFPGSREGTRAVFRRFLPSGIGHVFVGPDHLLFLIGLLLLGGSLRRLALFVGAFLTAHAVTLSLASFNLFHPPARIIDPAIALGIVYVGADNLMVRGGRDVRVWIACGFGLIHGFWFANALRQMDLPRRAFGWSLFSFNIGVEIGQVLVMVAVASALAALRARSDVAGRRLAYVGSVVIIGAGAFLFIQRVFFPGGIV